MKAQEAKKRSAPSTLKGIYAIWLRETKVFIREKPRIASALLSPVIWLIFLTIGFKNYVSFESMSYEQFIIPGVLMQTVIFSSLFYGAYLVWDRKIDLLKSVIVSPISRSAMFIGKLFGGMTIVFIEAVVFLAISILITGVVFPPISILQAVIVVIFSSVSLVALGLIVGSFMESPEGFQLLSTFGVFPIFFLSGAIYPLDSLKGTVFEPFMMINPGAYGVDMVRGLLTNSFYFSPVFSILTLFIFNLITVLVGIQAFNMMRH